MSNTEDFVARIEQLVRDHITQLHRSTAAALERAFDLPTAAPARKQANRDRRASTSRRDPEEVTVLAERLHAAVCATPGETMAVLAERLGTTARELNRPMVNLRRAGRLRSAGIRNQTRYFPATGRTASARAS